MLKFSGISVLNNGQGYNEQNSIDITPDDEPKTKRPKLNISTIEFEHSHLLKNLNSSLTPDCFECVQCNVKFAKSDQLVQHLDTHDYFKDSEEVVEKSENIKSCSVCDYSFKTEGFSEKEATEAMRNHVMIEHFKANKNLPFLKKNPPPKRIEVNKTNSELIPGNVIGAFRCGQCPRSFDQMYQRRIHERYNDFF